MAFNWEKGLLGAGLGALSGYDYMLKSKMKEEYETKMEEARAQRAENMQIQAEKRQQAWAVHPDNPARQDRLQDVKFREDDLNYRKQHDDRTLSLQEQEMKARAADRAAANADRDEARALRLQEYNERKAERAGAVDRAVEQAEKLARLNNKLQNEFVAEEAKKIYDNTYKMTPGTEEEKKQAAELTQAAFVWSGEKNVEGFRSVMTAQKKEYNNDLIEISKGPYNKQVEAIREMPKSEAITSANEILAASGKKEQVQSEAEAKMLLRDVAKNDALQAGMQMLGPPPGVGAGGALKGPGASTTTPPPPPAAESLALKQEVKDELIYRFAITKPTESDRKYLEKIKETNPTAYKDFIKEATDISKSNVSRQRFLGRYNDRQRAGQTSARDAELLNMDEKYLLNR